MAKSLPRKVKGGFSFALGRQPFLKKIIAFHEIFISVNTGLRQQAEKEGSSIIFKELILIINFCQDFDQRFRERKMIKFFIKDFGQDFSDTGVRESGKNRTGRSGDF